MKVRGWPVIVFVGAVLLAGAVYFREDIQYLVGGADRPPMTISLGFAHPVPEATVYEALSLVEGELRGTGATVTSDGVTIVVTPVDDGQWFDLSMTLDPGRARPPELALRTVEYAGGYVDRLAAYVRKDKVAADLGITFALDHIGWHLEVTGDSRYVNVAWAEKHHCDPSRRLEGTGVSCIVDAKARLAAFLHGDPELYVEPLRADLAIPADRELVIDEVEPRGVLGTIRVYAVEAGATVIAPSMISRLEPTKQGAVLTLTRTGTEAVLARATDPVTQLVMNIGSRVLPVTISRDDQGNAVLVIPMELGMSWRLHYDLGLAKLPARLKLLGD